MVLDPEDKPQTCQKACESCLRPSRAAEKTGANPSQAVPPGSLKCTLIQQAEHPDSLLLGENRNKTKQNTHLLSLDRQGSGLCTISRPETLPESRSLPRLQPHREGWIFLGPENLWPQDPLILHQIRLRPSGRDGRTAAFPGCSPASPASKDFFPLLSFVSGQRLP